MTQENTVLDEDTTKVIDEANPTVESLITEDVAEQVDKTIPYDRFKAKVDEANALKEKLAAFETAQAEKERKELEDAENYKALYEGAIEKVKQVEQQALLSKKSALLTQAGYDEQTAKLLIKLVDGEDDETIAESIKVLRTSIPTNGEYGDPGAFNGAKAKPVAVDNEEIGRNAITKVLHKIKL